MHRTIQGAARAGGLVLIFGTCFLAAAKAGASDWPMWRHDPARSASSDEELPQELHLQWALELPVPRPAWPPSQQKLQFDRLYEPILLGRRLFLSSMVSDKLIALDADTGKALWSFYADGPVRLAPVAWKDKVYFVSDDGCLYCLAAPDGAVLWKFRGGPSDRKLLGQDRLINAWPARGAPVIYDGVVYFAAGIWPFMGTFLHALDAETGRVIWTNSGTGSSYTVQQHDSPAFGGVAPQGYLAATEDKLLVAGGRTVPAAFDRKTGHFLHFNVASREMGVHGGGGYEVSIAQDFFLNRGYAYRLEDGKFIAVADATIVTEHGAIGQDGEGLRCYASALRTTQTTDRQGKTTQKDVLEVLWKAKVDAKIQSVFIRSGPRVYASGPSGQILAIDLPRDNSPARVSWSIRLVDEPLNMISGDGKLFVTSERGRLYCFGGTPRQVEMPAPREITLIPKGASWKYLDHGGAEPGWMFPSCDDSGWASGPAPLGYGDGGEATRLDFGKDPQQKRMTCYFRNSFLARGNLERVDLRLRVDDGVVLYLNGMEIGRIHMPGGEISATTPASKTVEGEQVIEARLPPEALVPGQNVIAAEVHQASPQSSDLRWELELTAFEGAPVASPEFPEDLWTSVARRILKASGAGGGYCIVLGIGSGRLVEEIASQSSLHVMVVEPDAESVLRFRRKWDAMGIYGARVCVVEGSFQQMELPPYMASLVTSEIPWSAEGDSMLVEAMFRSLRPFDGAACFPATDDAHAALSTVVSAAALDGGTLERSGKLSLLRRVRAPEGAANWTHQYGDAANTVASRDTLVKAPMELLWFGGPPHDGILPRHGHGPTPQVCDGRLFIEGRDLIRAIDIYTGRFLWERVLQDVGEFYDYESHEPGANAIGGNYVSLPDGIYVMHRDRCLRLDPASGATLAEYTLPPPPGEKAPDEWGFLAASEDILVAGSSPTDLVVTSFSPSEVSSLKGESLKAALGWIESWRGFTPLAREKDQDDHEYLCANLNKLLVVEDLPSRIPQEVRIAAKAGELEERLRALSPPAGGRAALGQEARILVRELLHKYYKLPQVVKRQPGKTGSLQRIGSRRLFGLERSSGKVLWDREAASHFRHNTIALGGGKVFCMDRLTEEQENHYRRRGVAVDVPSRLIALNLRTGQTVWSTEEKVFGTWLGYSEEHDILLQAGSNARDRSFDEISKGMSAHRGATGDVVWSSSEEYGGPCMIIGNRVITQVHGGPGFAVDILTGKRVQRAHPLTGAMTDWQYARNYGCNTAIGCPNLLTFRSAAAGYFDLLGDGGTGNFGGFRAGCTSNLIPAGGILVAPDYTRTCTCAYQNQTSLAMVHAPEAEMWTFQSIVESARPLQRLGINFGAPGDRRGPDGTLWLEYPAVGGPTPDPRIECDIHLPEYPRHHESRIAAGHLRWVAASGIRGAGEISIRLAPEPKTPAGEKTPPEERELQYTVRLVFAEIEGLAPGERVFDVEIQGKPQLRDFDICREAGGPWRTVIREFQDVSAKGKLRVGLVGRGKHPPLLCGVQVIVSSSRF